MTSYRFNPIRKYLLAVLLATLAVPSVSAKSYWLGDIDGDGKVTIADLVQLNKILQGKKEAVEMADVNQDGKIDKKDAQTLVDMLLGKIAKVQNGDGEFGDIEQSNPTTSESEGGTFGDNEQGNPGMGGGK